MHMYVSSYKMDSNKDEIAAFDVTQYPVASVATVY